MPEPLTQTDVLRRLTPSQRLAAAARLYWAARALKAAALRAQHPSWSEAEVAAAVRKAFLLASS